LFFHLHDNVWTQPLPVYFTAFLGPVVGSSDAAVRMPSVIVAALDAALIHLVAARLFGRGSLALLGAALLALAPLHFIHGRLALGAVYPVAFILPQHSVRADHLQRHGQRSPDCSGMRWLLRAATVVVSFLVALEIALSRS
jgi:Dolichyl-phosphate-mannose-protein mannosyltransferase